MKNAVAYLIEPLLMQYFLIDAICRDFMDDQQRLDTFRELARVFCVPLNQETEEYFLVSNEPQYKAITDYMTYERLCRTIEFAEKSGQDVALTAVDRVILAQKRDAMQIKSELFKQSRNLTLDTVTDTLLSTAMNGNVDAMMTLAYMEYHGLCICRDRINSLRRLRLCAKWNNLFGNLMGIAYDTANQANYYNTLHSFLRSANQRGVFRHLCECTGYQGEAVKKPVVRIIEKAFGMGIIRRNVYDRSFAQVAFSELVSAEDKEKLLLSKKQDAIASLSDLPFDAKRSPAFAFDRPQAENIPLPRQEELQQIFCAIYPAGIDRLDLYRTLLVAGDDAYISQMYADALRAGFCGSSKVIEVDAGSLSVQDFVGTKEHFLLRGLSESKKTHTVFFIKHCHEIGEQELEELMKLLDYDYRRKFNLREPTVSLNLSDVLIVLLADETNEKVRKLSGLCHTVWTENITKREKHTVIDTMFRNRSASFGIGGVELEPAGKDYLAPLGTEQILRLIDGALKKAACENESLITAASLRTISSQQNMNGSKREFGYLGGAIHETY